MPLFLDCGSASVNALQAGAFVSCNSQEAKEIEEVKDQRKKQRGIAALAPIYSGFQLL
jgi:hypothetical protein